MNIEWFRCNKCGQPMTPEKPPFSLAQCGHIFCQECMGKAGKNCFECEASMIRTMPLSKPFHPKIATLFMPCFQQHSQLAVSLMFQVKQHSSLARQHNELEKKYEVSKRVCRQLQQCINQLYEKKKKYKFKLREVLGKSTQSKILKPLPKMLNKSILKKENHSVPLPQTADAYPSDSQGDKTTNPDKSGKAIFLSNAKTQDKVFDGFKVPQTTRLLKSKKSRSLSKH